MRQLLLLSDLVHVLLCRIIMLGSNGVLGQHGLPEVSQTKLWHYSGHGDKLAKIQPTLQVD